MYCGAKNKGNVGELCGKCYVAKKEVGHYEWALMGNFNSWHLATGWRASVVPLPLDLDP